MLSIFRGFMNSRVGLIITFVVLGIIALAFGLGDVTGLRSGALGGGAGNGGATLATINGDKITASEMKREAERTLANVRAQYPNVTMAQFVAQGGLDQQINDRINTMAFAAFAASQGVRVGKQLVDSEISTVPAFKGLDGKFSRDAYRDWLQQRGMTDGELHELIQRGMAMQLLLNPASPPSVGRVPGPAGVATPYASMLLEKRSGTVAFIDTKKMPAGAPVTDAEAADYYKRNVARYTLPERRSVRYAVVSIADLRAKSAPSEAEVAKAYQERAAAFAPSEKRSVRQVVLLDQKGAEALAAKVRGGTAIDAAAKAVGLDAPLLADQTKAGYAQQTSPAIAGQVFGAAQGAVIGPVKTSLGWTVIAVDKITKVPGKSLDQARPDLVKELTEQKTIVAANAVRQQINEAVTGGATIDDIAKKLGLALQSSPPLDAQGADPAAGTPPAKPDPVRAVLAQVAFQADPEDSPEVAPIDKDGNFAVIKLDKVVASAARPMASVMDEVKKNFLVDRQLRQARGIASAVMDKVNKGVPLAKAMAETGLSLDVTKPIAATRKQLLNTKQPDPKYVLMFKMAQGTAKTLQAPFKGGWFVVVEDSIVRGDARGNAAEIADTQAFLTASAGQEYYQQFIKAVRDQVGVKRDEAAIEALRNELIGQGGAPDGGQ